MNWFFTFLCFLILGPSTSVAMDKAFPVGSLTGTLYYNTLKENQLTQLEFIFFRAENEKILLKAVLRLHFGDFASREYIAYRFDNVEFNPKDQSINFNKPSGPLTIKFPHFRGRLGEFEAEVWSTYGNQNLGKLKLQTNWLGDKSLLPIIEPLWGEYKGKCDGVTSYLQIKVSRTSSLSEGTENPFRSYKIFATFAAPDPTMGWICKHDPPRPCVNHIYTYGQYDFFSGNMQLFGTPSVFCQVRSDGITCDGCKYQRVSDETKEPRAWVAPESKDVFPPTKKYKRNLTKHSSVLGEYSGFLHHSYLNSYQAVKIHVLPSNSNDPSKISAMATLYFGGKESLEFLDYRFDPVALLGTAPYKLLLLSEANRTDALLEITSLTEDEIRGTWYSSLYGKIGNVYLKKDISPALAGNQRYMEPVGGHYLWSVLAKSGPLDFDIYIPVIREDVPPLVFGAQPFFPLNFNGYWTNRQQVFPKTAIPGGSYDFFTGRISFGNSLLGYRNSRTEVFVVPSVVYSKGAPLGANTPERITYIGPLK